ncbi:MAG: universal stress protein [Anaerolineae bacterium]|nr:universal stress protein [Anaerolineae bacterium]
MLNHVLVPLDGSPLAEDALKHALDVVAPNGKITLVCAVETPDMLVYGYYPAVTAPNYETTKNELLPYAKHYIEGMAKDLIKQGYAVRQEVKLGDAATVITNIAEKQHVDAIVMSTHGRSGISRFLFGSVTSKVLEAKVCPVFVVPSKQPAKVQKPAKTAETIN